MYCMQVNSWYCVCGGTTCRTKGTFNFLDENVASVLQFIDENNRVNIVLDCDRNLYQYGGRLKAWPLG